MKRKHSDVEIRRHAENCTQCLDATEQYDQVYRTHEYNHHGYEAWLNMIDGLHEWGYKIMTTMVLCWECPKCHAKGTRDSDLGKPTETPEAFREILRRETAELQSRHEHILIFCLNYREQPHE